MATLITGGAGFLGSHLMERLLERGEKLVCLDNFNNYYSPDIKRKNISEVEKKGTFELVEGDIRDKDLCSKIFADMNIDKVVHLAARAGVRASLEDPLLYQDVNCRGTMNLLELAHRRGVKKFVSASSSSVYGNNKKVPFAEDDWVGEPVSPYAATKRAGELFCHACHHLTGMPIVCLRFFTAYGPRQRPDMAIHKFTRLILNGEPIPMFGDGTTKRDYTYYSDIIDGVVASLDAEVGFEIINLGESNVVELRRLIEVIEENVGKRAEIHQLPEQPGDVKITYADVSKAKRLLGYSPSVHIEEGVRKFVEWYRENF
ncbi:MAG: NAD-dependent epimerase/dehydratase family protein [Planctomycetes bacterium]|nr:NAD-dependent epimerase/dehydratase family protein [Planctomycetota bacterium]